MWYRICGQNKIEKICETPSDRFIKTNFHELFCGSFSAEPYYGSYIGKLSNQDQGISGEVFSIDESTIFVKNFTYNGEGSGKKKYIFLI